MISFQANRDQARAIIEWLQASSQQELNNEFSTLNFRIGVTTIQAPIGQAVHHVDGFECLQRADNAMYAAKRAGKNQIHYSN